MGILDELSAEIKKGKRRRETEFPLFVFGSIACICFGLWQESWAAGLFIFFLIGWANNLR